MKLSSLRAMAGNMLREHHGLVYPHTSGGYWACLPFDSIDHPFLIFHTGWKPSASHQLFAQEICKVLNAQIAFDGVWSVCWTDWRVPAAAPRRIMFNFFDEDFDLQFVVDSDDPITVMVQNPMAYVHQCAEARGRYLEQMKQLEVHPNQLIKAAKGQPSADPDAMPDIMPIKYD